VCGTHLRLSSGRRGRQQKWRGLKISAGLRTFRLSYARALAYMDEKFSRNGGHYPPFLLMVGKNGGPYPPFLLQV